MQAQTRESADRQPASGLIWWLVVTLAGFLGLFLALSAPLFLEKEIKAGEVANQDFFAYKSVIAVDETQTRLKQERAAQQILPVFKRDRSHDLAISNDLKNRLDGIDKASSSQSNVSPGTGTVKQLADTEKPEQWLTTKLAIEKSARKMLQIGAVFPGVDTAELELSAREFLPESWTAEKKRTCARLIASVMRPTVIVDVYASRQKAEQAKANVKPVLKQIEQGALLVPKGNVISAELARSLQAAGVRHHSTLPLLASICITILSAFLLVAIVLYYYEPKHFFSPSAIGLILTISVVTCGIATFIGKEYPQFVPLPAVALLLSIFISSRLALVVTTVLWVMLGAYNLIPSETLAGLGLAYLLAIGSNLRQRSDLMLRGILIGIGQAAGFLLCSLFKQTLPALPQSGPVIVLQVLGGLSSCIVAIGSLPFLEYLFGLVTQARLAELTDPTQPLLRQLEENAPGTYQHSIAVANLAEAGARAIDADVYLVRAGSLYHDIGKMVRPRYFIENQLGDKNPHDEIPPEESRDRVLAHVTDGMALAIKHKIPRVVRDFIPQHQGTTLMAYFYHKACLRDGLEQVDTSFYRYPGPKPQSRETAIVMLADVSEAVTHSLKDPSQEEVEAAMSTVFKARAEDGQFLEAGISNDELERVKKAFARVWRTLHHERLKYPSTTTGRMAVPPEPPSKAAPAGQS